MRENQPNTHDDDDYIETPPRKKGLPIAFWLIFGALGLACVGIVYIYLERTDRRRAEAAVMEFEAREFEKKTREEAPSMRILAQTLMESQLESIGDGGEWTFTSERFVLKAGKNPLPKDLLEALLGPEQTASRIEGKWGFDGKEEWKLILTEITGDGKAGRKEARLNIADAGTLRLNIGEHQYRIIHRNPVEK